MKKDGLQRMLDFLNFLDEKAVHYYVEKGAPDCLRATLTLVGVRIEVAFFVDEIQYSLFKGNEDVDLDEKWLYDYINENWD